MPDHGDQVTRDVGPAVAAPLGTGVAAAADVDVRDPVPGGDEGRDDEAVGPATVAHPVREDDERAVAGEVVGDGAAGDGEVFGHVGLLGYVV
ncbi:hypothetical protein Cus16_2495 [Curtobacterium sp. ER1/6]|nr:hypothetical protein Cus16_2495 [Curtobacterium sp. ER1/6]